MPGRWVIGALTNNLWSYAGASDRGSVNQFLFQYFINYNFDEGWYFTSAPIRPETRIPTLAELHANIQDAFNENGVQIMSPHYESDPAEKVWVPREKWFERPAKPEGGIKK